MKIGYDAKRLFNNKTGLGNYSRAVVNFISKYHPNNELHLFSPSIGINDSSNKYATMQIHTAGKKNHATWRTYGISNEIDEIGLDIYHGLSHELPRNNRKSKCKTVVTIHDLIFKRHPEYFSLTDRLIYDWKWKHSIENADTIVAISESTKTDILHYYGADESKIKVVYNTCRPEFYDVSPNLTNEVEELPTEYMLAVGSVEPRKNFESIILAMSHIPNGQLIPLVIVGGGRKKNIDRLKSLIHKKQLEDLVILKTDITDDQMIEIYQRASFLVYPSYYEGHGLPITEALLCGTAVLSSGTSSMKEAGGPDSLYIDPYDVDDLSAGIVKMLGDSELRKSIATKGRAYALKSFDIETIANRMNSLYQSIF